MTLHRRDMLLASAASLAGLATLSPSSARAEDKPQASLRLCSQLGVIPGGSLEEKLDKLVKWGCEAVELPGDIVGKEEMYGKAAEKAGLKISAVCFGSLKGDLVSEDQAKRGPAFEEIKRVLTAAGALKSTGVIYVPAFNGQTKLTNQEIRALLVETLPRLGEHAVAAGTRLMLEPLNRNEAFFLRQLADGASICRDCNSPGVCMMGDFYHMAIEETSDCGAFLSAGPYLHHVHLASRTRVLPGQDDRSFVDGFRGLKMIGYQDFCSFECGVKGDRDVEIPRSLQFLKDQWAQA